MAGLTRLRTQQRWAAIVSSVGMLPLFPSGTLVGIASLVALSRRRVREVFGKEHQQIIRGTPQVRVGRSFRLLAVAAVLIWPLAFAGYTVLYVLIKRMPPVS